jgi:hypothetical protein
VRRNVTLRDSFAECEICVWGNHTHILNESSIGRPVTFNRICLTEYMQNVSVHMPKDASLILGSSPETVMVMKWFQQMGNTHVTIADALQLQVSNIIGIVGILGRIVSEIVTTKDGQTRDITTLFILAGPPCIVLTIELISHKQEKIDAYQVSCFLLLKFAT